MGVPVKATCSECLTTHFANLEFGQENITCPACKHSMKNLPEGELNELDVATKKQRTNGIISLVCFGVAAFGMLEWAFTMKKDDVTVWMAMTIVFFLVALVFGVLGSTKRFIVEF